eukprot:Rmarinus@m.12655
MASDDCSAPTMHGADQSAVEDMARILAPVACPAPSSSFSQTAMNAGAQALSVLVAAGVSLSKTNLRGIRAHRSYLQHAVLSHSDLRGARLTDVDTGVFRQAVDASALCFSPCESVLACGSPSGDILAWRIWEWQKIRTLKGPHTAAVRALAFSADSTLLVSGDVLGWLCLWDFLKETCVATVKTNDCSIMCLAFSLENNQIAVGMRPLPGSAPANHHNHHHHNNNYYNNVDDIQMPSGSVEGVPEPGTGDVLSLALRGKMSLTNSGSGTRTLAIWDVGKAAGNLRLQYLEFTAEVSSLCFSNGLVVVGSENRLVHVFESQSDKRTCIKRLRGHKACVSSVDLSPDGKWVLSSSKDGTVRLWDLHKSSCVGIYRGHDCPAAAAAPHNINHGNFHPAHNGRHDAAGYAGPAAAGLSSSEVPGRPVRPVLLAQFCADHPRHVVSVSTGDVRVWSLAQCERTRFPCPLLGQADDDTCATAPVRYGKVYSCDLSDPNASVRLSGRGRMLAVGHKCVVMRVWSHVADAYRFGADAHRFVVYRVAFSPDNRILASTSNDEIRLWDARTGECQRSFRAHTTIVTGLTFSPAGDVLASAALDGTLCLWDCYQGTCLRVVQASGDCSFSATGRTIAAAQTRMPGGIIPLFSVASGECVRRVRPPSVRKVTAFVFSPVSDAVLAVAAVDSAMEQPVVLLCDVTSNTWHRLIPPTAFGSVVGKDFNERQQQLLNSVAFSPRGDLLCVTSGEGTVLVWRIADRTCVCRLDERDALGSDRPTVAKLSIPLVPLPRSPAANPCDSEACSLWCLYTGNRLRVTAGNLVRFLPSHALQASPSLWCEQLPIRLGGACTTMALAENMVVAIGDLDGSLIVLDCSESPPRMLWSLGRARSSHWAWGTNLDGAVVSSGGISATFV